MRYLSLIIALLCLVPWAAYAQTQGESLLVVNGGVFGSTNYANVTVQIPGSGAAVYGLDTIRVTSIQDVLIDEANNVAYIAAQDSIVRINYLTPPSGSSRLAAAGFGAPSTVKLGLYQNQLLVGNFYAPFGFVGTYTNHLRVFDATTLAFIDTITAITKPAKDFLVVGDFAYVAQNSTTSTFQDTMGYLSVIDLRDYSLVRQDTLSTTGADIGRLVLVGDVIYSVNKFSNTISSYNLTTGAKNTVNTTVNLQPKDYGPTLFMDNNSVCYLPYDDSIGLYNLATNMPMGGLIATPGGFAFAVDTTLSTRIAVSFIDFINQSQNKGILYDEAGDSISTFQVGFSPEVLAFVQSIIVGVDQIPAFPQGPAFEYFPNPTTAMLQLALEQATPITWVISDLMGRELLRQATTDQRISLDVSRFPAGTYFLTGTDEKGRVHTEKFVKQ